MGLTPDPPRPGGAGAGGAGSSAGGGRLGLAALLDSTAGPSSYRLLGIDLEDDDSKQQPQDMIEGHDAADDVDSDLPFKVAYVLGSDGEGTMGGGEEEGRGISYASIGKQLEDRIEAISSSALTEEASPSMMMDYTEAAADDSGANPPHRPGEDSSSYRNHRIGPERVAIDKQTARGQLQYSLGDLAIESMGNFASARANVGVFAGRWMYETAIFTAWTPGIQQIGWGTLSTPFTSEEGVGDAPDSYAYDGKRVRKWNVRSQAYGEAWATGDVIGSCIDLDKGEISFYRNGRPLGVAFRGIRTISAGLAYFPTASISHGERCELNFGSRPFLYPVEGFLPMQAPPSRQILRKASYLLGCLERMAVLSSTITSAHAPSSGAPATDPALQIPVAASGVPPPAPSPSLALSCWAEERGVGEEDLVDPSEGFSAAAASPLHPSLPSAAEPAGPLGSTPLRWEDSALLAAAIGGHLLPLLIPGTASSASQQAEVEYIVQGPFLESLMRLMHGLPPSPPSGHKGRGGDDDRGTAAVVPRGEGEARGDPARARAAIRLIQVASPPAAFQQLCRRLLEGLARRCTTAPLTFPSASLGPGEGAGGVDAAAPASLGSHPFLSLACCLVLGVPEVRSALLEHRQMYQVLEAFLSRKPPSSDDLKSLLPTVWWKGCGSTTKERDETLMAEGINAFYTAKSQVEDLQYRLLTGLLAGRTLQGEDALVAFVRYLVQRNRGCTRDMPPGGLSDPNVLLSVWFILLRLLTASKMAQANTFPAGDFLVKASQRGLMDPTNDLPRLGGLLSFLLRESPASPADLLPVHVDMPPPLGNVPPRTVTSTSWLPILSYNLVTPTSPGVGTPTEGAAAGGGSGNGQGGWVEDAACRRLTPSVACELLHLSTVVYAYRGTGVVKQMHQLLLTMTSNQAALERVEAQISAIEQDAAASAAAAAAATSAAATAATANGVVPGGVVGGGGAGGSGGGPARGATPPAGGGQGGGPPPPPPHRPPPSPYEAPQPISGSSGPPELIDTDGEEEEEEEEEYSEDEEEEVERHVEGGEEEDMAVEYEEARGRHGSGDGGGDGGEEEMPLLAESPPLPQHAPPPPAPAPAPPPLSSSLPAGGGYGGPPRMMSLQQQAAGGGSAVVPAYLIEARSALRTEVQTTVRCIRLLEATLFGGWKMEALLWQTSWVGSAMTGLARPPSSPLLAFVPTCYLDLSLDVLGIYRIALTTAAAAAEGGEEAAEGGSVAPPASLSSSALPSPEELRPHGLDHLLDLVATLLNDSRIRNPDSLECLLAGATGVLECRDLAVALERSPVSAARRLVHAAAASFEGRLWHPASAVLASVVKRTAVAAAMAAASGAPLGGRGAPFGLLPSLPDAFASPHKAEESLPICRAALAERMQPTSPSFKGFFQRLFDQLNWAMTEAAAGVASLHEARRPQLIQTLGQLASVPATAGPGTSPGGAVPGGGGGVPSAGGDREPPGGGGGGAPGVGGGGGGGGGGGAARGGRPQIDENQVSRKIVTMLDLSKTLLKLLEFATLHAPSALLAPTCAINLTRYLELVPFVLGHLCDGPDARRLNELLEASRRQQQQQIQRQQQPQQQQRGGGVGALFGSGGVGGGGAIGGGLGGVLPQIMNRLDRQYTVVHVDKALHDKVNKAEILAPLVGSLIALWRADEEEHERQQQQMMAAHGAKEPPGSFANVSFSGGFGGVGERTGGGGGRSSGGGGGRNGAMTASRSMEEPAGDMDLDEEEAGGKGGEEEGGGGDMMEPWMLPQRSFIEALAEVVDERIQADLFSLCQLDWEASLAAPPSLPLPPDSKAVLQEGLRQFGHLNEALLEARGGLGVGGGGGTTPRAGGAAAGVGGGGGAGGFSPSDVAASSPLDIMAGREGQQHPPSSAGGGDRGSMPPLSSSHLGGTTPPLGGGGGPNQEEIPEEFLDPITAALMLDPVILPDSQVTVDRSTIERQLSIQPTDPFSRCELTLDMVKPNLELRGKIRAYLAEQRAKAQAAAAGGAGVASASPRARGGRAAAAAAFSPSSGGGGGGGGVGSLGGAMGRSPQISPSPPR